MSNCVFVLDADRVPQTPVHPAVARQMLSAKAAAVFKRFPFTIMSTTPAAATLPAHQHRLKIDPGSKTTGLALLDGGRVVWAAELTHRSQRIKGALLSRRAIRRSRRQRKTRYRQPRFLHRTRPEGWLPPSLQSRVVNVMTWVERLARLCPISALSQELVRFDMQLMQNAEITGVAYQHGELAGYEVREYLLEKWHRTCAYCGAKDVPLEVEHIIPKSRGGSARVSNLTLACVPCNQKKDSQTAAEFGYPQIQAQAKIPLKDAAAVNATRWTLYRALQTTGLPVETGTGGRTKYNRTRLGIPKSHWGDAACVGASTPETLCVPHIQPLQIKAMGHGTRKMCRTDAYGFPKSHRARQKRYFGMQTGDLIKAIVPKGKYAGTWISRVVVKASGWFDVVIHGKKASVHQKYCTRLWSSDGYTYTLPAVAGTAVSSKGNFDEMPQVQP
jgi:5-methylcytosine-specific restriction endonuclease McrA